MNASSSARRRPRTADEIATAAQLACLLEASARKPGNVSPGRSFADMRYEDFLVSALAIGPALGRAGELPLGRVIRFAIERTREWTPRNTNLGTVLLLTPLARAALLGTDDLRVALESVLADSTVEDAMEAYVAIRLANPGGLGRAEAQDVHDIPTVSLRETMSLAAHRDAVAREWATGFELTFDVGLPSLERARADGLAWEDAVVECYLELLSHTPDTHIARRAGADMAADVAQRASLVRAAGGVRTERGRVLLDELDRALGDDDNARNPGTTADLTAAAIFASLLVTGWP